MKNKSVYIKWGLTAIAVVAVGLGLYFFIDRFTQLTGFFKKLGDVLLPVVIGAVIAYLINPIVNFLEKMFSKLFLKLHMQRQRSQKLALSISIFLSLTLLFLLLYGLISRILPELESSISKLINNYGVYVDNLKNWYSGLPLFRDNEELYNTINDFIINSSDSLQTWLKDTLLGKLNGILSGLTFGIIGVFNTILDVVVGVVVSVYILSSKKKFVGVAKKHVYSCFRPEVGNMLVHMSDRCNRIFSGFISGKLLDSMIIGMLCFIALSLFNMPYTLLVSVIVGLTNIIPFFGPFIGAIPSAVLILLSDPTNIKQVLLFIIFIICLQQFDGNILGPKILGDSTGLSPLMVVISILIGGGFFGFLGMILGVPCFAVLGYILTTVTDYRLQKKGLPADMPSYIDLTSVDLEKGELHYIIPATNTASGTKAIVTRRINLPETTISSSFTEVIQDEIRQKENDTVKKHEEAVRAVLKRKKEKDEKQEQEEYQKYTEKQKRKKKKTK